MGRVFARLVVRLWGLTMMVASGYLWALRGPRRSRARKVGTLVCVILLVLGLLLALNYL